MKHKVNFDVLQLAQLFLNGSHRAVFDGNFAFYIFFAKNISSSFAFLEENDYIANSFETLTNLLKGQVAGDEEYSTNEASYNAPTFRIKTKIV